MPKTPPYFRFFPSDWNGGVSGLSSHEIGVYIQLCTAIFEGGGHVAENYRWLARHCGTNVTNLKRAIDTLVDLGKIIRDEHGLSHNRIMTELNHAVIRSKWASKNASSRWEKPQQKQRNANAGASDPHMPKDANQNQNQKEITPNGVIAPTPKSELMNVLDEDHAAAVIEHRKRIRSPLTQRAGRMLAKKFGECPDPNAAADEMIVNGWRGFEPSWLENRKGSGNGRGNGKPRSYSEIAAETAESIFAAPADNWPGEGDGQDDYGKPARIVDLTAGRSGEG